MPTKDKQKRREQNKRFYDSHPGYWNGRHHTTPEMRRRWNLMTRYGLTPGQIVTMLETQGGVCAVCGKEPTNPRIDHDHATGKVRGILCHRCNLLIAGMDDAAWLQKALAYLEKHRADLQ